MKLIRGLSNLQRDSVNRGGQPCVATIGNFDGVHCGHQMILQAVCQQAHAAGLPAYAVIFEPQPLEFFSGDQAPPRLTPFQEKVRLLFAAGVDAVVCLRFNHELRSMTPDGFVDEVLVKGLNVRELVVGDDFRFGHRQAGQFSMLVEMGKVRGFDVTIPPTCLYQGERVSSTRVRKTLADAELNLAEALLARRYSICGRVRYGQQIGRQLGIPTANLSLKGHKPPMQGVFAVEVEGLAEDGAQGLLPGVANLGTRPTLSGVEPLLEVHLLDFDESIYGKKIRVFFSTKIRDERRFDGLEKLQQQLIRDVEAARQYFGT